MAEAASKLEVPKKEELKLKPRSEWRYIGKDAPLYDLKDVVSGKGMYGQDTHMEGMLYASVMHPPALGTTPKSIDDRATLAVAGREANGDDRHIQATGIVSGTGRRRGAGR